MGDFIIHRVFQPCSHLRDYQLEKIVSVCKCCDRYFVVCETCAAYNPPPDRPEFIKPTCFAQTSPCLVSISAACIVEAGKVAAAFSVKRKSKAREALVVTLTAKIDPGHVRNQHRTELLAACYAIREIRKSFRRLQLKSGPDIRQAKHYVLLTDSQYIMMGMTNWIPGSRYIDRRAIYTPQCDDFDLFRRLDAIIASLQQNSNISIEFSYRPRNPTAGATALAVQAAQKHMVNLKKLQKEYWSAMIEI